MNLTDAITQVETVCSAYNNAANQTSNDQQASDAIQAKLDAAKNQVSQDQAAQNLAAQAFNSALDSLISAATDAKIPVDPPAGTQAPGIGGISAA